MGMGEVSGIKEWYSLIEKQYYSLVWCNEAISMKSQRFLLSKG